MEAFARIVVLARDEEPSLDELAGLPPNAQVVARGFTLEQIQAAGPEALASANIILNCIGAKNLLQALLPQMPKLKFIQSRFAGVDHVLFPELVNSDVVVTNAKGLFSPSLAEYCMFACSYFAKNLPRLMRQKTDKHWEKFVVKELRGATMGIIGYGSIGQACARLAKCYGMTILAQRRRPELCEGDNLVDEVFGPDGVEEVLRRSDYIVVTAPLTSDTFHMIGSAQLDIVKPTAILINLGRGPLVDESALIQALKEKKLEGAALDVFEIEPLPTTSELWDLDNVLLSPHCADYTAHFLHDSVKLFVKNVGRFLQGEALLNVIDKQSGY